MRHGDAYLRAVEEVYGTLHEALAEGAAAYDDAAVLVLHGTGENLCCRGGELVDEDGDVARAHLAVALGGVLPAAGVEALGVDDEVAGGEDLIEYVDGSLEVSAAVLL